MHGDEQKWVDDAIRTNWVSTVGANINEVEKHIAEYIGCRYTVTLSAGTAILLSSWPVKSSMARPAKQKELSGAERFLRRTTHL